MTRQKKWQRLTRFVSDVNVLTPHLIQFLQYENKKFIKFMKKDGKTALFTIPKKEEKATKRQDKETMLKWMGL